ncbi:MAG: DegT/DnrJ/EryC1/StrS family aminotransferase [Roseiflexaceae bacterium]|nr:DegT/DnrJ/EryC1/StrS family aminotransferase [Roseiflexaceae bacterium]
MKTAIMANQLAINGGIPVRTTPFTSWPIWDECEEQALLRALHSGQWGIGGNETAALEVELATVIGVRHSLTVTTGTATLIAALHAIGIGYGDEVIIPPYTFVATATACLLAGALPVFADIDPATFNIDPAAVEAAISPRTRAIMPVHIGGYPADMDRLMEIAQRHGLPVIEDAAQAIGAHWRDRSVGSIGDLGSFSFQSSKNINSGEGGALTTNNKTLYDAAWSYKNCGRTQDGLWYQHETLGDNLRMSQFQAAILRAQLTRLEEQAELRMRNGTYLCDGLRAIGGLTPQPVDERVTRHGFHLVIARYNPAAFGGWSRTQFLEALRAEGIPCASGYVPLYETEGVRRASAELRHVLGLPAASPPDCPVTERTCAEESVWIASQSALLGTQQDMDDILTAVGKIAAAA